MSVVCALQWRLLDVAELRPWFQTPRQEVVRQFPGADLDEDACIEHAPRDQNLLEQGPVLAEARPDVILRSAQRRTQMSGESVLQHHLRQTARVF